MKTVWIVLGVVCLIGAMCCGGAFFMGKKALGVLQAVDSEADQYAAESLKAFTNGWDPAVIKPRLSKTALPSLSDTISHQGKPLGVMKATPVFSPSSTTVNTENGVSVARVIATAQVQFIGGTAMVTMNLRRDGMVWSVENCDIERTSGSPVKGSVKV